MSRRKTRTLEDTRHEESASSESRVCAGIFPAPFSFAGMRDYSLSINSTQSVALALSRPLGEWDRDRFDRHTVL